MAARACCSSARTASGNLIPSFRTASPASPPRSHAAGHEVRFVDLCFERDPIASSSERHANSIPMSSAFRFATSTTATRSRSATTRRRRAASFARCARRRRMHRSSREARRSASRPRRCSAISAWTTPSPATASARASRSSTRSPAVTRPDRCPASCAPRWDRRLHAAGRGRGSRLASSPVTASLDRSRALRAARRHHANADEARLRVQVRLLHVSQCRRLGISHARSRARGRRDRGAAAKAGVRHFDFVDSTFNSPPGHAIASARRSRAASSAFSSTPRTSPRPPHRPSCSPRCRRAGFRTLGITAESASDRVLERLEKGFNAAKVREVAERVEQPGIRTLWIFLVGGPGENDAHARGDAVVRGVAARRGRRRLSHRWSPHLSGHDAASHRDRRGRRVGDSTLLDPTFYFSPRAAVRRHGRPLEALRRRLIPRFMFSADSRSPMLPYLTRAASVLRLPRPHWQYMGLFQRSPRDRIARGRIARRGSHSRRRRTGGSVDRMVSCPRRRRRSAARQGEVSRATRPARSI